MMEAARTSETSVNNYFTRQYIPEDKSERLLLTYILSDTQNSSSCINIAYVFIFKTTKPALKK
jgi:hypothetical protein